jgi:hypothetical protein
MARVRALAEAECFPSLGLRRGEERVDSEVGGAGARG